MNLFWFVNYCEQVTGEKLNLKSLTADCFLGIHYAFNKIFNGKCFGKDSVEIIDYISWTFLFLANLTDLIPQLILQMCFRHVKVNVCNHFTYHDSNISKQIKDVIKELALHTVYRMKDAIFQEAMQYASMFISNDTVILHVFGRCLWFNICVRI